MRGAARTFGGVGPATAKVPPRIADHIAAGRAVLQRTDLAGLDGAPDQFDKAFAVNVNVFWTTEADAECRVLARVLRPGGELRLVYGGPEPATTPGVGPGIAAKLGRHGFETEVTVAAVGALVCVTGRLAAGP